MLGIHQSFDNPMSSIANIAARLGCDTFQIFIRNNRNLKQRFVTKEEMTKFNAEFIKNDLKCWVCHAPYIMNPSSPEDSKRERATAIVQSEFSFLYNLSGPIYYVLHPGSHMSDVRMGYWRLFNFLKEVQNPYITVCLEYMAGAGTELLSSSYYCSEFMKHCEEAGLNVGLTLDTCHVYASGESISKAYEELKKWVKVIHWNGSSYQLGSHMDRHESLTKGYIPLAAVEFLKDVPDTVPIILETPAYCQLFDLQFAKDFLGISAQN